MFRSRNSKQLFSLPLLVTMALLAMLFAPHNALASEPSTTVILEFNEPSAAVWKSSMAAQGTAVDDAALANYRGQLVALQDAKLDAIASSGISFAISSVDIPNPTGGSSTAAEHRFTLVLNAVAIHLPISDVAALRSADGVKDIHRLEVYEPMLDKSVQFTRANELYGNVHELTAYHQFREGYEGQGVNVAVIDTGIEFQHQMFGGDPTPPRFGLSQSVALIPENQKVIYNMPYSDLAVEDGFGHGTHVASTAAGYLGYTDGPDGIPLSADDVPLHGVAPQARLMSYGVCSDVISTPGALGLVPVGGCLNVNTIMALEDAVSPRTLTGFIKPVADVINLSLGGINGTPDDATAIAASNAGLLGAVVVAAAGNSGDVRSIVGSPSTGRHVISVAAMTDPGSAANWYVDALSANSFASSTTGVQAPADQFATDGRTRLQSFPLAGTPQPSAGGIAQYMAYVDGALTAADYPASVSGRIALVNVGGVGAFGEIMANATANGAVGVLLIGTTENGTAVKGVIPGAVVIGDTADYLVSLVGSAPQNGDISNRPVRIRVEDEAFLSNVSGFSSRGPVAGLGQIKPDLSAPGVNVLAALPPASLLGALEATSNGVSYGNVSGTSMASPHVAGAAALVYQANPGWSPDMVRTALINTSTPMRNAAGDRDTYGTHNPKIHSQGGGAMDVFAAANAQAMMGVLGDGIQSPGILGSYSFGEQPVVGNLCLNEERVEITVRDLRGSGGTYQLSIHDNRNGGTTGVSLALDQTQITVPSNGSATFTAGVNVDGSTLSSATEVQFFVVADRVDGTESLSMPVLFAAVPSAAGTAGQTVIDTEIIDGSVEVGSTEAGVGQQSEDFPFQVSGSTFRMLINFEADAVTSAALPDLDLELLDPNGNLVATSGNIGSIESIDTPINFGGTYVLRVINYASAGASFTATIDKYTGTGAEPATLSAIATEHTDDGGDAVDFDGSFTLQWSGNGNETGFQVQQSDNGSDWTTIATVGAATSSLAVSDLDNGNYTFRVLAEFPGVLCTFVADPSNEQTVQVDHRQSVDVTDDVSVRITGIRQVGSEFEVDLELRNESTSDAFDPVTLSIIAINGDSAIEVLNADNGGNGRNSANAALFDYSAQTSGDALDAGETSGHITVRFANPNAQLFSFDALVSGHVRL